MKWTVIRLRSALCAVVAVTASAQSAPPTKEPGKLIVGFDLPAPGFWNGRATGTTHQEPDGLRVRALAGDREAGSASRASSILRAPFGGLFSPAPKKYDFAFEEVTITAARAKVVAFSTPYFDANQGVLIRKGLSPKPTKVLGPEDAPDVRSDGRRPVSPRSSTSCDRRRSRSSTRRRRRRRSTRSRRGRCDALILDMPIVVSQSKKKKGAYGGVVGQIVTNEFYGAVLEKGSKFKPVLDQAIGALRANGTIQRLQAKWLPFTTVPIWKIAR